MHYQTLMSKMTHKHSTYPCTLHALEGNFIDSRSRIRPRNWVCHHGSRQSKQFADHDALANIHLHLSFARCKIRSGDGFHHQGESVCKGRCCLRFAGRDADTRDGQAKLHLVQERLPDAFLHSRLQQVPASTSFQPEQISTWRDQKTHILACANISLHFNPKWQWVDWLLKVKDQSKKWVWSSRGEWKQGLLRIPCCILRVLTLQGWRSEPEMGLVITGVRP